MLTGCWRAVGVSWRHRDKSCLERVLANRTAEGATARKRSGTRTADSRDLWRAVALPRAIHRRGVAPTQRAAISQVQRTEGQGTPVLVSLCSFAVRLRWV